ncbi:hypothetical protein GC105_15095 [Alkalibaculum sp. M08DMB]|uniref:tRNA-specific adenosine deaminase n=1 Tax=Alkalibaculum sporogenes TaxID=2655001 RepID=A0A6A7KD57_9FIRM|nr:nucleoside deaminase [Alkalibaculum sporogenes]MPW27107.1 hypothetical protein [Alkalibaculum sporogenes]
MKKYMEVALELARYGKEIGEVPVGALVVKEGVIIAKAHNEVEITNNPVAHAEMLAIQRAAIYLKNWRLHDCTLYVTLEPCIMCMGAILNARITKLVYGSGDNSKGAVESQTDLFRSPLFQNIEIYPGILEEESKKLLKNFFYNLRE